MEVSLNSDRIMSIKLAIGDEVVNIMSAYASQVGLDPSIRQNFGTIWRKSCNTSLEVRN